MGNQACKRVAVTHGLAEGDNVRYHRVSLMPPHMLAGTGEARLHLVGDEQTTGLADQGSGLFHEPGRHAGQALVGEQGIDQQRGRADALGFQRGDGFIDVGGVLLKQLLGRGPGRCLVQAGDRHCPGVGAERFGGGQRGGDLGQGRGVAVVVIGADDDAGAATGKARQAQGQFVGLATGAGEHHGVQRGIERRGQALGIADDLLVEVASVDVQLRGLAADCFNHVRVTMAHTRNVVVHVQVAAPVHIEQPHTFAAHQVQRVVIEQRRGAAEHAMTALQQGKFRHGQQSPVGRCGQRAGHAG
ncbi:hypothetical protein D9M71_162860 [compost metagenome]